MNEALIYILIAIIAGLVSIYTAIRFLKDPEFAKNYIQKSPKAFIWRKLLGEEKSLELTKNFFAPFGLLIGVGITLFGIYFLIKITLM